MHVTHGTMHGISPTSGEYIEWDVDSVTAEETYKRDNYEFIPAEALGQHQTMPCTYMRQQLT